MVDGSDTESEGTIDQVQSQSQSTQESPFKSGRVLKKWTRHASDGSKDSKDGAPSSKKTAIKKETDNNGSSSPSGLTDEVLHNHRFMTYGKDSDAVHEVRAKILGLEADTKPSQQDIDSSPSLP